MQEQEPGGWDGMGRGEGRGAGRAGAGAGGAGGGVRARTHSRAEDGFAGPVWYSRERLFTSASSEIIFSS